MGGRVTVWSALGIDVVYGRPLGPTSQCQRRSELRVLGERGPEPLEIPRARRHRSAPDVSPRGVRESNETLAALRLEELDDGGEPALSGTLRQGEPFDPSRAAPGCRGLRLRPCR